MADIFAMVDTWNNGATTFTALKMNVTDTASAAGSLLMDLQVGGVSKASMRKDGAWQVPYLIGPRGTTTDMRLILDGIVEAVFQYNGVNQFFIDSNGRASLRNGASFGWSSSDNAAGTLDTILLRDAANTLAQRNGTAAQAFRLYNTQTDPSNYERGGFDWQTTANTLRVRSEAAGTGTVRIIAIDGFSKAGAAVAGDIPAGTWALVRDTVGATTKLIYNNAGTLMTVALA